MRRRNWTLSVLEPGPPLADPRQITKSNSTMRERVIEGKKTTLVAKHQLFVSFQGNRR